MQNKRFPELFMVTFGTCDSLRRVSDVVAKCTFPGRLPRLMLEVLL